MFVITPEPNSKIAYSINEVSQQTSLGKSYLRKKIKDGELEALRIGTRVLILHEDLYKFLKAGNDSKS